METLKQLTEIYYSSDVSIEDHANLIVFKNADSLKESIYIDRLEDTEQYFIYTVELFKTPSDSWINKDDLKSINSSCDTNYIFNKELTEQEQYFFTSDLCWYYGAHNFDSYPNEFLSYGSFIEWLESRKLI